MDHQSHIDRELEQLRVRAASRDNLGRTLDNTMTHMQRLLKRDAKRLGGAGEAWASVCPATLIARTAITGLNRGELRIAVADSAAMYELDRHLRTGGEAELSRASSAPINRVRLTLDARPFAQGDTR